MNGRMLREAALRLSWRSVSGGIFQTAYAIANLPPPNCHKTAIKTKTVPVALRSVSIIVDPSTCHRPPSHRSRNLERAIDSMLPLSRPMSLREWSLSR